MMESLHSESLPVAVKAAKARQLLLLPPARPLVERFGTEFFRDLPKRAGVYLMCSAREGVLYVGKARNLRQRLGSYRSADPARLPRKMRRLLVSVERIYWDECPNETAAIERERQLLLTLQPKFNSVGTYPAPQRHLGWQRTADGFAIGFGDVTTGWAHRFGGFTRIKPVYVALLRLIWWALHPARSCYAMPSPLLMGKPPAKWRFNAPGNLADELECRFADFLEGRRCELPDRLLQLALPETRFEQRWREQDADCLREFYERVQRWETPPESPEERS